MSTGKFGGLGEKSPKHYACPCSAPTRLVGRAGIAPRSRVGGGATEPCRTQPGDDRRAERAGASGDPRTGHEDLGEGRGGKAASRPGTPRVGGGGDRGPGVCRVPRLGPARLPQPETTKSPPPPSTGSPRSASPVSSAGTPSIRRASASPWPRWPPAAGWWRPEAATTTAATNPASKPAPA